MHYGTYTNKRTYIVSKLPEESNMNKLIRSSFEDPLQYLKIDKSMIVGRTIKGPRTNAELSIVPHSIVGSVSMYEEGMCMKRNNSNKSLKYSAKPSTLLVLTKREEKPKNPTVEQVDDQKLKGIFHDYANLKFKNSDKQNDFLKKIPETISHKLLSQEHELDRFQREEKRFNTMAKYLVRRTKKAEHDLLVNNTDYLRTKREINQLMENETPLEERYGPFNWMISLRRPKNFSGTRHSFINLGSPIHPVWQTIKETIPQNMEYVRSNNTMSSKEYTKLTQNDYLNQVTEKNFPSASLKKLGELKSIDVKGQDLLKVEIDNSKKLHGKKLLYKREHLDNQISGQGANGPMEISKASSNMLTCQLEFLSTYNSVKTTEKKK